MKLNIKYGSKIEVNPETNYVVEPTRCRAGFRRYTIVAGDTMYTIARRFNISLEDLLAENSHISDSDTLNIGDVICVPRTMAPGNNDNNDNNNNDNNDNSQIPERCRVGFSRYTVVAGDTIYEIARRYNVTVDFLIAENPHITNPEVISPGDVLCVPTRTEPENGRVPDSCPRGYVEYTVRAGDTINSIAQRLGVSRELIVANNPHISDPNVLLVGDVLCVPTPLEFPEYTVLMPTNINTNNESFSIAIARSLASGRHQISILALNLPLPETFGDYDYYDGFVGIPGIGGYGFGLSPITDELDSWSGTIAINPYLTRGSQIYIVPHNAETGESGRPIMSGIL